LNRRRSARTIAQAAAVAEAIGPHTLNLRLPESGLPAEVLPIVQGVNGALSRLEQAAETQRDFLRRAAHQLRTPMTVLSARVQTLDDSAAAAELRADIKQLSRIISQLLQLNEIDALPEVGDKFADLGAVGEAVTGELAPVAARQQKSIELTRPAAPVLVRADPNVVEIAIRNLVENAVQHSPAGAAIGVRIGAEGCLEVIDSGPGIGEELRERIFEPFWSGDPRGSSVGLGLTIVSRVARRCGARVTIGAAPGGGACFAMHFQQYPVPVADIDPAQLRASIPASLTQRRRREALDAAAG
jgi:signal transduction histidine kinase